MSGEKLIIVPHVRKLVEQHNYLKVVEILDKLLNMFDCYFTFVKDLYHEVKDYNYVPDILVIAGDDVGEVKIIAGNYVFTIREEYVVNGVHLEAGIHMASPCIELFKGEADLDMEEAKKLIE